MCNTGVCRGYVFLFLIDLSLAEFAFLPEEMAFLCKK